MSLADTIIYHDIDKVTAWLTRHPETDLNRFDEYGFTPLIEAAIFKKNDIAEFLLEKGALVDFADSSGRTPLHWAVDNRNRPLVQSLIKKKANPNAFTLTAQPILAMPLLRGEDEIKQVLYDAGANLEFAQDYINGKLISHRFELQGYVHLVAPPQRYTLLDAEGFFLEFSLGVMRQSLTRYRSNFAAKELRHYFNYIDAIGHALVGAEELIHFQHYAFDPEKHNQRIKKLLSADLLVIPAAYQGHAITFIRYKDLFVKCDRGANSEFEGTVVVYHCANPALATADFFKKIIYTKQDDTFMHQGINRYLNLRHVATLPLPAQQTGNCSWANVEAAIPAMLFCLFSGGQFSAAKAKTHLGWALDFYDAWHRWDQDRALNECIQSLQRADITRARTKASLLGMVLFQSLDPDKPADIERARTILKVLTQSDYDFILKSYIKVYAKAKNCGAPRFMRLLRAVLPKPNRFLKD